ncbi:hypothetical protein ACFQ7F_31055 [Streptomyces sp. NPDC056486]|uniref:DUF7848 domain-containing protein n=1 Tax=Streptomyces sp. NPDC056486 TaxID=3345835 RepID=UPI0036A6F217
MRSIYRFVAHRLRRIPGSGPIYLAICTREDCHEDSGPSMDQVSVNDWAVKHCGTTEHDLFIRIVSTDYVRVHRD